MKKILFTLAAVIGAAGLTLFVPQSASADDVSIAVYATMAPNFYGSPSFDAWAANGIYAAENGLSSYGAAGPTQYSVTASPLPVAANFVTGFPSWEGQADPAAPYNSEFGTRASFVGVVNGNGGLISINNLGFNSVSSDVGNALGFGVPPGLGGFTYDQYDIGLIFNNAALGISSGIAEVVDGGDASQLVDEIISIGAGDAYASYLGDDPAVGATDQDNINYDAALAPDGYGYAGEFYYGGAANTASFDFSGVPDTASTLPLLGLGILGLAVFGFRKNRRQTAG